MLIYTKKKNRLIIIINYCIGVINEPTQTRAVEFENDFIRNQIGSEISLYDLNHTITRKYLLKCTYTFIRVKAKKITVVKKIITHSQFLQIPFTYILLQSGFNNCGVHNYCVGSL